MSPNKIPYNELPNHEWLIWKYLSWEVEKRTWINILKEREKSIQRLYEVYSSIKENVWDIAHIEHRPREALLNETSEEFYKKFLEIRKQSEKELENYYKVRQYLRQIKNTYDK